MEFVMNMDIFILDSVCLSAFLQKFIGEIFRAWVDQKHHLKPVKADSQWMPKQEQ